MKRRYAIVTLLIAITLPTCVLAADGTAQPQPLVWWQILAGVLAIPAATLGMIVSFLQIQKTRLEARKIALEVLEKETALGMQRKSKPTQVTMSSRRGWLIVTYSVLATVVIAGYTYIFQFTEWLPITDDQANEALSLLLPLFCAQMTMMALWVKSRRSSPRPPVIMPFWASVAPLAATALFGTGVWVFVKWVHSFEAGNPVNFLYKVIELAVVIMIIATIRITPLLVGTPSADQLTNVSHNG